MLKQIFNKLFHQHEYEIIKTKTIKLQHRGLFYDFIYDDGVIYIYHSKCKTCGKIKIYKKTIK